MRKIVLFLSVAAFCVASISVTTYAGSGQDNRAQVSKIAAPDLHSLTPAPEPQLVPVFNTYDMAMNATFVLDYSPLIRPCVIPVAYTSALHKAEYQVPDKYGNS